MTFKNTYTRLPGIESLKGLYQSLAILDAILSPEWEYRYYSFDSKWDKDEMTASMRNGSGDEYFILFNDCGAIIKGFAHESPMSPYANESERIWKGVLDDVPEDFVNFLREPAFSIKDTTFCIWRRSVDRDWQVGIIDYPNEEDPDGSEDLLSILDGNPATYKDFAEKYYETEVDISLVEQIYKHNLLTGELVSALNENVTLDDLKNDIEEIGYPVEKY